MATALDVLKYMKSLGQHFYGEMQAQKLVYYAQAWTVTWDGAPLFDEPIRAWEKGPVVTSLRHQMERLNRPSSEHESSSLTPQQQENIRAVVEHYGAMNGTELSELTHEESPWKQTVAERESTIPLDLMRAEYTKQSLQGSGPKRVPLEPEKPDPEKIRRLTDEAVQQWSHTLALLAE